MNVAEPFNVRIKKFIVDKAPKTFLLFDLKPEKTAEKNEAIHHIHILDRSGSMRGHIEELMNDVKKTLCMMADEDFVTVIWFSGAGEYRTVIKCAKNDRESIGDILDSLKSVVGCTCFSDPIKELEQIINETSPACGIFNVTIFTDGDTVTPWPMETELHKIFTNLNIIKDKILAFNAVGYGNYYNRELLLKMTKVSDFGQLAHASHIEEYSNIFNNNKNAVSELSRLRLLLSSPENEIICLSSQNIKLFYEKADIRIGKQGNTIGVVADGNADTIQVEINGVTHSFDTNTIPVTDFDKSGVADSADILYAFAYSLYYEGQRKRALAVLNLLGDKTLIDKQHSAFTTGETGEYLKTLKNCALRRGKRCVLETDSNTYLPNDKAFCVLDVLQKLVELDAEYFPAEDYKRIGRKVVDEFNCFVKDGGQQSVSMRGLVLNQERLNISIRFDIKGKVKLNPKRAGSVGLPSEINAKIYRVHTIVRDGSLHIDNLRVKLKVNADSEFFQALDGHKDIVEETEDGIILDISLAGLPVINNSYLAGFDAKKLLDSEIKMLQLEAEIKVLNALLKESGGIVHESFSGYTEEQIQVLKEHGIGADMVYSSVAPKKLEAGDYNVIKEFRTLLKGFSSLPALPKVITKTSEGKKLTPAETLLFDYYIQNQTLTQSCLLAKKTSNQKILNSLRFESAGAKLAIVLTGDWLQDLQAQDDGSYTYSDSNHILWVKLERKEIPV